MLKDRDFLVRMTKIVRYAIVAVTLLTILSFLLPYYTYSGVTTKETQDTISILGYIGFPTKFPQMKVLMKDLLGTNIKYLNIKYMLFPISTLIFGIVSICVCIMKKGLGTALFPLWVSVFGLCGYLFKNPFLSLGNHPASTAIQIACHALLLILTVANILVCVLEIKSRPADYYLPMMD